MPFTSQDLVVIGFLVFLEGILSIDNALVLALLARGLPKDQQKKALTYGLVGAVIFRLISLGMITYLMKWTWVKFVGGGYLLFISLKHLIKGEEHHDEVKARKQGFWRTVLVIELTDIAFAVDSILAAVALSNKFWVVFTGGFLGVVMMRFAATVFLKLLQKYPKFETTAYLLVLIIGLKLVVDGFKFPGVDFHSKESPASWIFWATMLAALLYGFKKPKASDTSHAHEAKVEMKQEEKVIKDAT